MLDAAREAISFAAGRSREDLDDSRMFALSLVQCLQIIGEAANNVSEACRGGCPDIPWPSIIGMRHRLVHVYFDIDLDVVWKTVTQELPTLVPLLADALQGRPPPGIEEQNHDH